jgi:2-oxoglutarate/2-oxoacid ferredoxin oxidoreductase subunit alpha
MRNIKDDISIVIAGEAGQGIQSIESILTKVLKKDGYHLFSTKEYMSRIRGGVNTTEIRISSKRMAGYVEKIDLLIILNQEGISHLSKRISGNTLVIGEKNRIGYQDMIDVPLSGMAAELGNTIYSGTIAAGIICGMLGADQQVLKEVISGTFKNKSAEIQTANTAAGEKGYAIGQDLNLKEMNISIKKDAAVKKDIMLSGSEAISLGALAGGCNYVCAYPMSPSTGILVDMAEYSKTFDVIVEQVEDEIGVINMGLGAWYAGARALVTTAGGGFALMSEGLSLCGMIESPLVLAIGQRPGPATGLPTRTEQADLNLVLYAGHGEFPRVIFAPGTLEEGFYLTQKAFNLADKYQVPVFILGDQFYLESYYNTADFKMDGLKNEKAVIKTEKDYKRFAFTKDGISSRGIPGFGEGYVCVDSDEHDESGHITEDLDIRNKMVEKRLRKSKLLEKETVAPSLTGPSKYKTLLVCWGSNYFPVKEAYENLGLKDTSMLHLSQVYPLHPDVKKHLEKAENIIMIENNATGQMSKIIFLETGIKIERQILKYNGMPFSVEELETEIKKKMNE